jgi:hypothetical protein
MQQRLSTPAHLVKTSPSPLVRPQLEVRSNAVAGVVATTLMLPVQRAVGGVLSWAFMACAALFQGLGVGLGSLSSWKDVEHGVQHHMFG